MSEVEPYGVFTGEALKVLVDSAVFKEVSELKKDVEELLSDARKLTNDAKKLNNAVLTLIGLDYEYAYQNVIDIIEERENS